MSFSSFLERVRKKFKKSVGDDIDDQNDLELKIHHTVCDSWQMYDVDLGDRGYGWEEMIASLKRMLERDLNNITTFTVSDIVGDRPKEIIEEYRACDGDIDGMKTLRNEYGVLSAGGISDALALPVKIVWINQSHMFRIFTLSEDQKKVEEYLREIAYTINDYIAEQEAVGAKA